MEEKEESISVKISITLETPFNWLPVFFNQCLPACEIAYTGLCP